MRGSLAGASGYYGSLPPVEESPQRTQRTQSEGQRTGIGKALGRAMRFIILFLSSSDL
jgi:hypothetical protein